MSSSTSSRAADVVRLRPVFGINGGELLVLLLLVVIVVGPQRLPEFAEQLAGWVRSLRAFARDTRDRVSDELEESGAEVDWESLDPRRYDPRRIVREALLDDEPRPGGRSRPVGPPRAGRTAAVGVAAAGTAGAAAAGTRTPRTDTGPTARPLPPFDPDLT